MEMYKLVRTLYKQFWQAFHYTLYTMECMQYYELSLVKAACTEMKLLCMQPVRNVSKLVKDERLRIYRHELSIQTVRLHTSQMAATQRALINKYYRVCGRPVDHKGEGCFLQLLVYAIAKLNI